MKRKNHKSGNYSIRQKAEKILKERQSNRKADLSEADLLKLVHELQVHQIELELQNEELMNKKDFIHNIIEFSPYSIWISDNKGNVIKTNSSLRKALDLDDNQIVGSYNVLHDQNLEEQGVMELIKSVFYEKKHIEFTIPWEASKGGTGHSFKKGRDLLIRVSMFPVLGKSGELNNVVCQWVDITEEKEIEAIKQQREKAESVAQELNIIINSLSHPFYVIDPDTYKILLSNEKCKELGEITPDTKCYELTHKRNTPCQGEKHLCPMAEVLKTGKMVVTEHMLYDKNGKPKHFDVYGHPVFDDKGNVVKLIEYTIDLTEKKLAKQKQDELFEKYKNLVENLNEWVWEVDNEGRYTYSSPKVKDILGYEVDEIIGRTPFDLMTKGEAEKIGDIFREIFLSRKPFKSLVNVNLSKSGDEVILETSGVPKFDDSGAVLGYRGVDRDITHLKNIEKQLLQKQKMEAMGELAGGIAHDFNNYLATIQGYASLFLDDYTTNDCNRNYIEKIMEQTDFAAETVRQVLSFARSSTDDMVPLKTQPIIKSTLKLIKPKLDLLSELEIKLDRNCGKILCNEIQIRQLIQNLCLNAVDAMEGVENTKLSVLLSEVFLSREETEDLFITEGSYLKLSVKDNGVGILPSLIDRVFDPFYTSKSFGKGTGIGLSIVQRIVKTHCGAVEVVSKPGKGTDFIIYIPIFKDDSVPTKHVKKTPDSIIEILIVEDEPAIQTIYKVLFKDRKYSLTSTKDGAEALKLFKADPNKFDIVITDQRMPLMTGIQLSNKILKIRPLIPIILITGYSDLSKLDAKKNGIRHIMNKPINFIELVNLVNRL